MKVSVARDNSQEFAAWIGDSFEFVCSVQTCKTLTMSQIIHFMFTEIQITVDSKAKCNFSFRFLSCRMKYHPVSQADKFTEDEVSRCLATR